MVFLPDMTDAERAYCTDLRMLSIDAEDREIFIGLSRTESEWYHRYLEQIAQPFEERDPSLQNESDRFFHLHDKHEKARFEMIGAENETGHTPVKH